jgi:phosphorylcholine metabolism protein LicD
LEKLKKKDSVSATVNNLVKRIVDEKHLDEYLIRELSTHYIRKKQMVSVEIDYYKFNPEELKAKPVEEQIHTVLIQMGYSESAIRRIEYRKFWSNSDAKVWVADVYDENYNEALNEPDSYGTREVSGSLMETAEKVLDFRLYFDFY